MKNDGKCPIWGTPATVQELPNDVFKIDSSRAGGNYEITFEAEKDLAALAENMESKQKLTQLIVENIMAKSMLRITTTTLEAIERQKISSPDKRAGNLLRKLIIDTEFLGEKLPFSRSAVDNMYGDNNGTFGPLMAWSSSQNIDEVLFLLQLLDEQGFISLGVTAYKGSEVNVEVIARPPGYAQIEADIVNPQLDQAFVAMWFDKTMDEAYEKGFERAIREAGFAPLRIDLKEHVNKIDDEIIAEIRRSRFIVADFTARLIQHEGGNIYEARGGVYFETGFALGLRIPVIWTCREDMISHVHFDTRQFNHIVWKDADDLCTRLLNRIGAVIGDGPLKDAG